MVPSNRWYKGTMSRKTLSASLSTYHNNHCDSVPGTEDIKVKKQ